MMRSPLKSLLCSLRRRLWLERGLLRLRTAAWAGTLTLLALSCYSAFFSPVSTMHAAAAALAAFLAISVSAVFLRPSLPVCARTADRIFETSSLLLTALEVGRSDGDSPAGRVVANQANRAAPELRRRLGITWTAPPFSSFVLALIPLFASMVLLSYTMAENGNAAAPGAAESLLHAIEYELEDNKNLVELRNTMVEVRAQPEPRSTESVEADAPLAGAVPDEAPPGETTTFSTATAPGHGREAGESQAEPGAAKQQLDPPSTAPLTAVNMARRGDGVGADGGGEFGDTTDVRGNVPVPPAAAPASPSDWSTLSPAQVAYARRYLDQREADDD